MTFLAWIAQALGLVPAAVDAGKQIAEAVKPSLRINPKDSTLWHCIEHKSDSTGKYLWCTQCQQTIPLNLATTLCEEAVRERTALYS